MNKQNQIKELLIKSQVSAYKEIRCFGSQIMVTCFSNDAAEKWADLLGQMGCSVKPIAKGKNETKNEQQEISYSDVFRVWGTI